MKFEKGDALKLKHAALWWLRCEQRCAFIATEAGPWNADVLGINEKKIVEVEVKISLSDLKAEFQKNKHSYYKRIYDLGYQVQWTPNVFYLAVTDELVEPARELLNKHHHEDYGIITLSGFKVVKRAKKIHEREPNSKVKFQMALRMGSELIRFHEAWV